MPEFRRRDEHSHWFNPRPISDVHEALSLLGAHGDGGDPTHLRKSVIGILYTWEIVYPWYREGTSGQDSSGEDYFDIIPAIAEQLRRESLVQPFVRKGWGWSCADPEMLVITPAAAERLHEFEDSLRAKASTLLTPGTHTDLSGIPGTYNSGREHWRTGRFYVDYETPQGDTCRVYPEQEEVICPFPPKEEVAAAA